MIRALPIACALIGSVCVTASARADLGAPEPTPPPSTTTPLDRCRARFEQARADVAAVWPAIAFGTVSSAPNSVNQHLLGGIVFELVGFQTVFHRVAGRNVPIKTIADDASLFVRFQLFVDKPPSAWRPNPNPSPGWPTPILVHLTRSYPTGEGTIEAGGTLPKAKLSQFVAIFTRAVDECAALMPLSCVIRPGALEPTECLR